MPQFTPTEQRILSVLADGEPHSREELYQCIDDELANRKRVLAVHICNIRLKLKPYGQTIVCQIGGIPVSYRHVVLLRDGVAQ